MTCEFCGSTDFTSHQAREMMHGFRDEFQYLECKSCGCVKIASVPDDLARYYPTDSYYSYAVKKNVRTSLRRVHLRLMLSSPLIARMSSTVFRLKTLDWIRMFGLERDMRILDVGSGGALFIRDLRSAGYAGALGLDPYIATDIHDETGLAVKKAHLSEIDGPWDRVMFHHSLEHIADQIGTLVMVRRKLSHSGQCIVRIPVVNWAWRHYGTDWVQLDAPRHLCVHTEQSFRMAAEKTGFKVSRVIYDSWELQFWGSELYKKGIPLQQGQNELARHFPAGELRDFRRRSDDLNHQGRGDQAMFFLESKN